MPSCLKHPHYIYIWPLVNDLTCFVWSVKLRIEYFCLNCTHLWLLHVSKVCLLLSFHSYQFQCYLITPWYNPVELGMSTKLITWYNIMLSISGVSALNSWSILKLKTCPVLFFFFVVATGPWLNLLSSGLLSPPSLSPFLWMHWCS